MAAHIVMSVLASGNKSILVKFSAKKRYEHFYKSVILSPLQVATHGYQPLAHNFLNYLINTGKK
jgi:hypothetical protein